MVKTLNPFVDLYMCETMSTADEAYNAASAANVAVRDGPSMSHGRYQRGPALGCATSSPFRLHSNAYRRCRWMDISLMHYARGGIACLEELRR